jgi:hypothetical protein
MLWSRQQSLVPAGSRTPGVRPTASRSNTELSLVLSYAVTTESYILLLSWFCLHSKSVVIWPVCPQTDTCLRTLCTHLLRRRLTGTSTSRFRFLCSWRNPQTPTLSRTSQLRCSAGPLTPCKCTSGAMAPENSIRPQPTRRRCSKTL